MKRRRENRGSSRSKLSILDYRQWIAEGEEHVASLERKIQELTETKHPAQAEYKKRHTKLLLAVNRLKKELAEKIEAKAAATAGSRAQRLERAAAKRRRKAQQNLNRSAQ